MEGWTSGAAEIRARVCVCASGLNIQPRRVVHRARVRRGLNGAAGRVTLEVGLSVPSAPVR